MEDWWWVALIGAISFSVLTVVVWPILCRANGGRRIYTTIETAVAFGFPTVLAWVCVLAPDSATATRIEDWMIPAGGGAAGMLLLLMLLRWWRPKKLL
jgi:hypothetical protein